MYIPINLATEPFRRDRPIFLASVACGVLLAGLLAAQAYLFLAERTNADENRKSVDSMRAQLATIQKEQATVTTTLQNPVNSEVLTRSYLLNNLVERKSISWARLLADIEGVLPDKVRVIQVRLPQVNAHNEVTLDMEVGSQQPEQMVEFVKRLEGSPLFGEVSLARSDPPTQNEPLFRYRLSVSYRQKLQSPLASYSPPVESGPVKTEGSAVKADRSPVKSVEKAVSKSVDKAVSKK